LKKHQKNRIRIAGTAAALAVVLAGTALYLSPYWTLQRMRAAAEARDAAAFSSHVDFPTLTENLKGQLMRQMTDTMGAAGKNDRLSGLGQMLAVGLLGQMVDSFVSPASVMRMVAQGKVTVDMEALGATPPDGSGQAWRHALRYRNLSTALLRAEGTSAAGAFVFTRRGLWSWKLTAVELPEPPPNAMRPLP
jgi:hypothetical protein